jgi:hypothetical protein
VFVRVLETEEMIRLFTGCFRYMPMDLPPPKEAVCKFQHFHNEQHARYCQLFWTTSQPQEVYITYMQGSVFNKAVGKSVSN